jgi:polysaccharide pyruvyl transferase CsaB
VADGRGFLEQAQAAGWTSEKLAHALASRGVTSLALRPSSLRDLLDRGILTRAPASLNGRSYLLGPQAISLQIPERLAQFTSIQIQGNLLEVPAGGPLLEDLRIFFSQKELAAVRAAGLQPVFRLKNSGFHGDTPQSLLRGLPEGALIIFDDKEALGYPASMTPVARAMAAQKLRVGLVEFAGQRGVASLARRGGLRMQSVHSIPDDEMEKYPLGRVLPRWVRAASERRVRVFYLNPFPLHNLPVPVQVGLEANLVYLERIVAVLKTAGYHPGVPLQPAQEIPPAPMAARFVACLAAGVSLAWVLSFFRLLPPALLLLLGVGIGLLGAIVGGARGCGSVANGMALAAACTAPAAAVLTMEEASARGRSWIKGILLGLPGVYLASLLAGVVVAALLSDPGYLTRLYSFRGVKLVYLGPLALVGAYHLHRVEVFRRKLRTVELGMLGLGALLGLVYLLRSGNFSPIPASGAEHKLRDTLEAILPYRPRTKEVAFGYPGLGVLATSASLGDGFWMGWSSLAGTVAGVSATNSFCHLKTPFSASAGRGLIGLLFGLPLALMGGLLYRLLLRREERPLWVVAGYAGMGNFGDDWITHNLLRELQARRPPEVELVLLTGSPETCLEKFGVRGVARFEFFSVLQVLRNADFFCTGPGGLIQDRTSWMNSAYYLGLHALARLVGIPRVAFLGEGFGPLRSSFLRSALRFFTASSDLCLVRDPVSRELVGAFAQVVPDASLWGPMPPPRTEPAPAKGALGLVLRHHPEAGEDFALPLAQALGSFVLEHHLAGIQLLPACPDLDASLTRRLEEALSEQGVPVTAGNLQGPEQAKERSTLAALVSMRLHGCLVALEEGIPLLALPYDPKVEILLDVGSYPHRADPLGPPEEVSQALKELLETPNESVAALQKANQLLRQDQKLTQGALDLLLLDPFPKGHCMHKIRPNETPDAPDS